MIGDAHAWAKVTARVVDRHGKGVGYAQADRPVVMFALFFRRCAPCEGLLPGEWLCGDSSCGRNQIVSDEVVALILEEPFARPGIEEKLLASSFGNFPGFAASRRHKAVRSHEIAEGASDLLRGSALWKSFNEGQCIRQFQLKHSLESKGLSLKADLPCAADLFTP
jgi:hypothetical protein